MIRAANRVSIDRLARLCNVGRAMARLPQRDLATEVAKHFRGTPGERIATAIRLGREALDLFLATQPVGMTRQAARRILQRNKNRGRQPSAVTH